MTTLRIEKVNNSLPTTLTPNTFYFVKLPDNTVETYITDSAGNVAYKTGGTSNEMDGFLLMGATGG